MDGCLFEFQIIFFFILMVDGGGVIYNSKEKKNTSKTSKSRALTSFNTERRTFLLLNVPNSENYSENEKAVSSNSHVLYQLQAVVF